MPIHCCVDSPRVPENIAVLESNRIDIAISILFQILIHSDAAYVVGMVLFAWSGGHLGALCMMFGPKLLPDPKQQSIAASVMVACLVIGLAVGAALSSICVMLL